MRTLIALVAFLAALLVSLTSTSCVSICEGCALACGTTSVAVETVCPFYRPRGLCGANGSGDEIVPLDRIRTVDGGPPPAVHDTIAIARDPYGSLFGTSTTASAYSIARAEEWRVALACKPGDAPPAARTSWPSGHTTDPPSWDPPPAGTPGVTSCAVVDHPRSTVIVRQELSDELVRYFIVFSMDY